MDSAIGLDNAIERFNNPGPGSKLEKREKIDQKGTRNYIHLTASTIMGE